MRFSALLGLVLLVVARHAGAESPPGDFAASTQEPDESAIELGPPPPPPPGAEVTEPEPAPLAPEPAPIAPNPTPILEEPEPDPIVLSEAEPSRDRGTGPSQRPGASRWYGWKILIADGGALTLAMVSQPAGSVLGGGAYVLTAPAIHLGHKRALPALGSLGMRIAAPLVIHALMGEEPCDGDLCLQPGIMVGATLASLVDVIVLAHEAPDAKATKAGGIAPVVALTRKSAGVGLAGSF